MSVPGIAYWARRQIVESSTGLPHSPAPPSSNPMEVCRPGIVSHRVVPYSMHVLSQCDTASQYRASRSEGVGA
eukprot:3940771-Rhodomonas_salina.2